MAPDQQPDPIALALEVAATLERLGIPYLVGGSLASSIHGQLRSTNDVDFVADVRANHVAPLLAAFRNDFYVSEEAVREALQLGTSFNAERLERRQRLLVRDDPPGELFLDTAEHTVLRKLEGYRRGGEVSDRQWRDVLGVLHAKGDQLDAARLDSWARRLGVADRLERAREQAG